ncbi:EF-P lysine aminoacylase EpmA [Pseudoroseicyclus tamaricis]|uniref:EF-P lysine aminoacylase GenX n=1 Tax=Pseudoroseicyclus tamaricis TaxID=2705421 RepID=A0A6B2JQ51_9RHOB|nr:EF-P lysine aminoacylase EpmA [Pseudoroseicyclus tamaricis]NDV00095.1 EF-P lysine aminoacylase GenX [Pseudoroseicyclus tamaricis]
MTDRPWWHPARHEARAPLLRARSALMGRIRGWFAGEGFLEADPAALQASPGNEVHLHGLAAELALPDGRSRAMYLHTSPEFAMKKLIAAGEERLVSMGHVWRGGERGPLHHPEFTMLEWYRAGAPYEALWQDCAALLRLAGEVGGGPLRWRGAECDPALPPERVTVAEAFAAHAGIDLDATLDAEGLGNRAALAAELPKDIRAAEDDSWADLFAKVLTAKVEPRLGLGRATILDRYPACEAALARRAPGDPAHAERFELYACGVELANGFGELTDAAEQRSRFTADMEERRRRYGSAFPLDEDFLSALEIMPPASGIALGFDRLVVLATGAPNIESVLWAPVPG